jgi:hypothetical protein
MPINPTTSDDWYEQVMSAHQGLCDAHSRRLDAALVLLLADRIADPRALRDCIDAARVAALAQENA